MTLPNPFFSRFAQKLVPGQSIDVIGKLTVDATSVGLNLLAGGREGRIVLHENLRFKEKKLVLNAHLDGTWGKEERCNLIVKPGDALELRIRVHQDKFELNVNGVDVAMFKHRADFEKINYIQISGDIQLEKVALGGKYYKLPFESVFQGGFLRPGQKVEAYVTLTGMSFSFNFVGANGDILFHWNPRLKEKKIARNSCKGGIWENEENEGPFPIQKNVGFHLTFVNEPYSIQILINNNRIGTFAHRANPAHDYKSISISGEIDLESVEIL